MTHDEWAKQLDITPEGMSYRLKEWTDQDKIFSPKVLNAR